MDLATFHDLLAPAGQAALAAAVALAPTEQSFLADFRRLSKQFPADLARAALETAALRAKARAKFTRADAMYFTREALGQATGEAVARYRAGRFAGFPLVGDFCCGLGGDTVALAEQAPVVAVDADPLRLALAAANAAAYGVRERVTFCSGDLLAMPLPDVPAAFLDPDRRAGGRRHVAPRHYRPPPDAVRARLPADFPLGVKVAPAVARDELAAYDAEVELISLGGELKECVLWFGPLRTAARRATVLLVGATLTSRERERPEDQTSVAHAPGSPRQFLYDPDPAVTRAGLIAELAEQLGADQLDPELAFLTSDTLTATPFARAYRIEEALPFQAKRLAALLRARGVGTVTVLKRGSAVDPAALVRQLKLKGEKHRVVVLTRVAGEPYALVGTPA
jgi:SAM-dependent methyltransferase